MKVVPTWKTFEKRCSITFINPVDYPLKPSFVLRGLKHTELLFHVPFHTGGQTWVRTLRLGHAFVWVTILQAGTSQVRFHVTSLEFFIENPSGRIMSLGSTQPLTEMSTKNISWRGGQRRPVRRTVNLATFMYGLSRKYVSFSVLES